MLKKTQKTKMALMKNQSFDLSRRKLLLGALQATGLVLFSGCEKMFNGLQQNRKFLSLLESAEGANRRVQKFLTGRNKLAQEFTEICRPDCHEVASPPYLRHTFDLLSSTSEAQVNMCGRGY